MNYYDIVVNRVKELIKDPQVQKIMEDAARYEGQEEAVKKVYLMAIATLYGSTR